MAELDTDTETEQEQESAPGTRASRTAREKRREENRRRHRDAGLSKRASRLGLDPSVAQTLEDRRRALRGISGGAYYRVKRLHPLPPENQGTPQFLGTFDESDLIDDLTVHFRTVAAAAHWGNGRYLLEACANGQRGVVLWTEEISLGDLPEPTAHAGGPSSVTDQIKQVGETVAAVRAISGDPGGASALDTLTRAFSAGATMAKGTDTTTPILTMLMPVVAKVVERLLAPPPEPPPRVDDLDRTLKLMEVFGIKPRQPDPAPNAMAAVTEAIGTAQAVVQAANGLAGGRGGEGAAPRVSWGVAWAESARVIAPILGQAISQITGTVREVVEARKMEHFARAANARTVQPPPGAAVAPPPPASGSPLAGLEHAIQEGIHTPEVFSVVVQRLEQLGHGALLPLLRDGTVTADQVLTEGRSVMPELDLPRAQDFIRAFIAWIVAGSPAPSSSASPARRTITVRCTTCGNQGPHDESVPLRGVYCNAPSAKDPNRPCGGAVVRLA